MAASVTSITPTRSGGPAPAVPPRRQRPFRDNPRLILAGIAVLVAALAAILFTLANQSPRFTLDFLSEFVLYALTAADLTMLVALVFVLARNIVKLLVERRHALPFARFRAKLVALLLGMTLVPAVLVLAVGSELIRTSVDRWFNAPMDDILSSANQIAGDYYHERQLLGSDQPSRVARTLGPVDLTNPDAARLRQLIAPDMAVQRVENIAVYRAAAGAVSGVEPVLDVATRTLPPGYTRAAADRLAAQTLAGSSDTRSIQALGSSGELLHGAAVIKSPEGKIAGVVVATDFLTGQVAARSRRMTQAFEDYNQLRVLKRPLTGVYLSFFLMVTLMILVSAIWMGLYLAKRITRPVQMLAAAAREIGAGRLDQRVEPQSDDEFGALTEAFNTMAGELATSRRKVERSTIELERKHHEVERRRRYIETILERIATGVVSVDAAGNVTTINSAAARLLNVDRTVIGQPVRALFARPDLQPVGALLNGPGRKKHEAVAQEIPLSRDGNELHLGVVATALVGDSGLPEGQVLVFDDVTPLIRAQKVAAWREVARRLAHEIKNPLTPIQLSAQRLRRRFARAPPPTPGPGGRRGFSAGAPPQAMALVEECTQTIVGEVESLKGLVDEFSQFARMPSPRAVLTDLHGLLDDALSLYRGLFTDVQLGATYGPDMPKISADPEQLRRVIINLIDNAIEAVDRRG